MSERFKTAPRNGAILASGVLALAAILGCREGSDKTSFDGSSLRDSDSVGRSFNESLKATSTLIADNGGADGDNQLEFGRGPLEIGQKIPDFELVTIGNKQTSLEKLRDGRPMVFVVTGLSPDRDIDDQLPGLFDVKDELGESIAVVAATYETEITTDNDKFPIVKASEQIKNASGRSVPTVFFTNHHGEIVWKRGGYSYDVIAPLAKSLVESQQIDSNALSDTLLPYDIDPQYANIGSFEELNSQFVADTRTIIADDIRVKIRDYFNDFFDYQQESGYGSDSAIVRLIAGASLLKEENQKNPNPILRSYLSKYGSAAYLYVQNKIKNGAFEEDVWLYYSTNFNPDLTIDVNFLTDEQMAERRLISKEHRPDVSDYSFENTNGQVEQLSDNSGKVRLLIFVTSAHIEWAGEFTDYLRTNDVGSLRYEPLIIIETYDNKLPGSLPELNDPNARYGLNLDISSHINDFQRSGTPHLSIIDRDSKVANVFMQPSEFDLVLIMLGKVIGETPR